MPSANASLLYREVGSQGPNFVLSKPGEASFLDGSDFFRSGFGTFSPLFLSNTASNRLIPPAEFHILGSNFLLTNTMNVQMIWEIGTENIALQQIMTFVSGNPSVVADLSPSQNSYIVQTTGGQFWVRKLTPDGAFRDSDGASITSMGNAERLKTIVVDLIPPQLTSFNISSTPNGATETQLFDFTVNKAGTSYLRIMNKADETLYFSSILPVVTGNNQLRWNGTSSQNIAQDGAFYYALLTVDPAGNTSNVVSGSILYDRYPPTITLKEGLAPRKFSPNGDGRFDTLITTLSSNEPVTLSYRLTGPENQLITSNRVEQAVTQCVSVLDFSLKEGRYLQTIQAFDKKHNLTTVSFNVEVDLTSPTVSYSFVPKFSSKIVKSLFQFTVSEPGIATLSFAQKTVTTDIALGSNSLLLDGSDITENVYVATLDLMDRVGNNSTASVLILVDRTPPLITAFSVPATLNMTQQNLLSFAATDAFSSFGYALSLVDGTGKEIPLSRPSTPNMSPTANLGTTISMNALIAQAFPNGTDAAYMLKLDLTDTLGNSVSITRNCIIGSRPTLLFAAPIGPVSLKTTPLSIPVRATVPGQLKTSPVLMQVINNQGVVVLSAVSDANGYLDSGTQNIRIGGTEESTSILDGVYQLLFQSTTEAGIVATFSTTIDIDHAPPQIVKLTPINATSNLAQSFQFILSGADRTQKLGQITVGSPDGQKILASIPASGSDTVVTFNPRVQGLSLADGVYRFPVTLSDSVGNSVTASIFATIDTAPPVLSSVSQNLTTFSPNGDGIDDIFHLIIDANEKSQLKVQFKNQSGAVIKTITRTDFAIHWDIDWTGYSDAQELKEGAYTLSIFLTDMAGNTTQQSGGTVAISNTAPSIHNLMFSQEKMSINRPFTLTFDVPNDGKVSANITDTSGKAIRTLANNLSVSKSTPVTLNWDGKNTIGTPVRDGEYLLILSFTDSAGHSCTLSKAIDADSTAPAISDFSLSHAVLGYPSGNMALVFRSSDAASVTLNIYDAANTTIGSFSNPDITAGMQSLSWNGKLNGTNLPVGSYAIEVVLSDKYGNNTAQKLPFQVLNTVPIQVNFESKYGLFTPDGDAINETLQGKVKVQGTGTKSVKIAIQNAAGTVLKELYKSDSVADGTLSYEWDGLDARSVKQIDGKYVLQVQVTDALGNTSAASLPIYLLTQKITLNYQDNGSIFSFNNDGKQDQLNYQYSLIYPSLLYDIDGYNRKSNLKIQVLQNGALVSEQFNNQVTDRGDGSLSGQGISEGPFLLTLSGEGPDRIQIQTVSNNYTNDITPPTVLSKPYITEADGNTDSALFTVKTNAHNGYIHSRNASILVAVSGAKTVDLFNNNGILLSSVSVPSNNTQALDSWIKTQSATPTDSKAVLLTAPCSDGANTFWIRAWDAAGNQSVSTSIQIISDINPPQLSSATSVVDSLLSSEAAPLNRLKAGTYQIRLAFNETIDTASALTVSLVDDQAHEIPVILDSASDSAWIGHYTITDGSANGSYALHITSLTDYAGNQLDVVSSNFVVIDTIPPAQPKLISESRLSNTSTYSNSLSTEVGATVNIVVDGQTRISAVATQNSFSFTLTALTEGTHTLTVTQSDPAGNTSTPLSQTIEIDLTAPTLVSDQLSQILTLKAGTYTGFLTLSEALKSGTTPTLQLVSSANTIPISVTSVSGTTLFTSFTVPANATNGTYQLLATQVTDAAGTIATLNSTTAYTLDVTAPATPTLSLAKSLINTTLYTDTISVEPGTTVRSYVDSTLVDTRTVSANSFSETFALSEGSHTLKVEVQDAAGNISTPLTHSIVVDLTAPTLVSDALSSVPALKAGTYQGSFQLSEPVASATVTLQSDTSSLNVAVLSTANNQISVQFTIPTAIANGYYHPTLLVSDFAGNIAALTSSKNYLIDTTRPNIPIWQSDISLLNTTAYANTLSVEPGTLVKVLVDGTEAFSATASTTLVPISLTLAEGTHTLLSAIQDLAGNISAPLISTVSVDLTPISLVTDQISSLSTLKADTYTGSIIISEALKSGTTPTLQLVSSANTIPISVTSVSGTTLFTSFTVPANATNGTYRLLASQVTDAAGNIATLNSTTAYTLDVIAPATPILALAKTLINTTLYSDTISVESGTTVRSYVDSTLVDTRTVSANSFSETFTLSEGSHILKIDAQDVAENISIPLSHSITVDLTPISLVTDQLSSLSMLKAGTYTGSIILSEALKSGTTPTLQLVSSANTIPISVTSVSGTTLFTSFTVPANATNGTYQLLATQVIDAAGNVATLNSTTAYTLDVIAPATPILSLAKSLINTTLYTDTISVEPGTTVRSYVDSTLVDTRTVSANSFSETFALSEGSHTLKIDAQDAAGNISSPLSHSITVDLTPISLVTDQLSSLSMLKAGTYTGSIILSEALKSGTTPTLQLVSSANTIPISVTSVSGTTLFTSFTVPANATNGTYQLLATQVTDAAGNIATLNSSTAYTLDVVAPIAPQLVQATLITNQTQYRDTVVAEPGTQIWIYDNDVKLTEFTQTSEQTSLNILLKPGTHTLGLESVDTAGNHSTRTDYSVLIDVTDIQISKIEWSSSTPVSTNSNLVTVYFSKEVDATQTPTLTFLTASGQTRSVTLSTYSGTTAQGTVTFQTGDDGQSTFQVSGVYDLAGNRLADFSEDAFFVDTTAPSAPTFVSANALVNNAAYTFQVQGETGTTLFIQDNGSVVQTVTLNVSPKSLSLSLSEGSHTLTAQLKDSAGNDSSITSQTVLVDLTKPTLTQFTMATPSPVSANTYALALAFSEPVDSAKTPVVSVLTQSGQTRSVTLSTYSGTTAQGTVTFQAGDDGQSTLQVSGVYDVAGNQLADFSENAFFVDTTAPSAPTFVSANALVNNAAFTFQVQGETGTTLFIQDNGTVVQTVTLNASPKSLSLSLSEGSHTLTAQLKDSAGNISSITSQAVLVDLTKPTLTQFTMATPSPVSANTYALALAFSEPVDSAKTPVVSVLTQSGQTRTVTLSQYSGTSAQGTVTFQAGDDGQSTLQVSGVYDVAGNQLADFSENAFFVDTTAPSGPTFVSANALVNNAAFTFQIKGETGTTLFIQDNGTVVQTVTLNVSPKSLSLSLSEGSHTLTAQLKDSAGNISSITSQAVLVDLTKPTLSQFSMATPSPVSANTYALALAFSEPVDPAKTPVVSVLTQSGQTRTVSLNSYSGTSAQGTVTFQAGDDGQSTLQVSGVYDLAGNSISPYQASAFLVDTTAPTSPTFVSPLSLTNSSTYTLQVQGETGTTLVIQDNGSVVQTVTLNISPKSLSLSLSEGSHTLTAQLKDSAGNVSSISSQAVLVDLTKPTLSQFTMAAPSPVSANTYAIALTFSEPVDSAKTPVVSVLTQSGQTRTVSLSSYSGTSAQGTVTFQAGDDGQSTLQVSGVYDLAGNSISPYQATAFLVDTTAPTGPTFVSPLSLTNSSTYTLQVQGEIGTTLFIKDNGSVVQTVTLNVSPKSLSLSLAEGSHTLTAQLKDSAGNVSSISSQTVLVDLTKPTLSTETPTGTLNWKAGTYLIALTFSENLDSNHPLQVSLKSKTSAASIAVNTLSQSGTSFQGQVFIPSNAANETYQLTIQNATDLAGNTATITGNSSYQIDTVIPVLTFTTATTPLRLTSTQYSNSITLSEPNLHLYQSVDGTIQDRGTLTGTTTVSLTLSEGTHNLAVWANDAAGNTAVTRSQTVVVDLTPPALQTLTLGSGPLVKAGTYGLTLIFSEPLDNGLAVKIKTAAGTFRTVSLSSSDQKTYAGQVTLLAGDDGQSTVELQTAKDLAGNALSGTSSLSGFLIDTTPPAISSTSLAFNTPVSANGHRSLGINVAFSEPVSANYALILPDQSELSGSYQSSSDRSGTLTFDVPKNIDGQSKLAIRSWHDAAGNISADAQSFTVTLDSKPAEMTLDSVVASTNRGTDSALQVILSFSEPIQNSVVQLGLQYANGNTLQPNALTYNSANKTLTASFLIKAVEETLKLSVSNLLDSAGNKTTDSLISLGKIDNTPPVISNFGANTSSFSAIRTQGDAAIVITMNITEDYQRLLVQIYDGSGTLKKTLWDKNGSGGLVTLDNWNGQNESGQALSKGWYIMKAYAIDTAGNSGDTVQGLFEITEQHLTLSNPQTLVTPYSFKASGTRAFTYTLSQRIDSPDVAQKPGNIRMMSVPVYVAKVTEQIYRKNSSGPDTLIATLVTDQPTTEFANGALGTWNGRLNNDSAQAFVQSGDYYQWVSVKSMKDLAEGTISIPFKVDHDAPILSGIVSPTTSISTRSGAITTFNISFGLSDAISTRNMVYQLSQSTVGLSSQFTQTAGQTQASFTVNAVGWALGDGNQPFTLSLTDEAQNISTATVLVKFDSTVPSFNFTIPAYASGNVTVNLGTISDGSPTTVLYKLGLNGSYQSTSVLNSSGLNKTESVYVKVTDQAGNSTELSRSLILDNSIQAPTFTTLPASYSNNTGITLNVSHSEANPDHFRIQNDGTADTTYTSVSVNGTVAWTLPNTEGSHTIGMRLVDKAGNISSLASQTIVLDKTPPSTSSLLSSQQVINPLNSTLTVTINATDSGSGIASYRLDIKRNPSDSTALISRSGSSSVFNLGSSDLPTDSDASFVIVGYAIDRAGNVSSGNVSLPLITRKVLPTFTAVNASGWQNTTSGAQLSVTATSLYVDHLDYKVYTAGDALVAQGTSSGNGASYPVFSLAYATLLSNQNSGVYSCDVRLVDQAGNSSAWTRYTFYFDKTIPVITGASVQQYSNANQIGPVISISATDSDSGIASYQFQIDSGAWLLFGNSTQANVQTIAEGSHSLKIRVLDAAGNASAINTYSLTIDRTLPVITALGNSKAMFHLNNEWLSLSPTVTETGSGILGYNTTIRKNADNSLVKSDSRSTLPITFSGNDIQLDGAYTLSLTVVDMAGNTSSPNTLVFTNDNLAPTLTAPSANQMTINTDTTALVMTYAASDSGSGLQSGHYTLTNSVTGAIVKEGDATTGPITFNAGTLSVADGTTLNATVTATDGAGNTSTQTTAPFCVVDKTPPVLTFLTNNSQIQATVGAVPAGSKPVLLKYTLNEPTTVHTVRILSPEFGEVAKAGFTPTAPIEIYGGAYQALWDGWLEIDGKSPKQLPEGRYVVEVRVIDRAGNIASYANDFMMTDDIPVASGNIYAPSIETSGSILKWGEGNRRSNSVSAGGNGDYRNSAVGIDIAQTGTFSYWVNNGDSNSGLMNYFGLDPYQVSRSNQNSSNLIISRSSNASVSIALNIGYYFVGASCRVGSCQATISFFDFPSYKTIASLNDTPLSITTYVPRTGIDVGNGDNTMQGGMALINAWLGTLGSDGVYTHNDKLLKNSDGPIATLSNGRIQYGGFTLCDLRTGTIGYLLRNNTDWTYKISQSSSEPGFTLAKTLVGPGVNRSAEIVSGKDVSVSLDTSPAKTVAWVVQNTVTGARTLYYQKVDFANTYQPGDGVQFHVLDFKAKSVSTPTLKSPKASLDDIPVVAHSKPEFVWQIPTSNLGPSTRFKLELYKGVVTGNVEGLSTFNIPVGFSDNYQTIDIPAGTYTLKSDEVHFTPDDYNALGKTTGFDVYRWQIKADWAGTDQWTYSLSSELFKVEPPLEIEAPINYPNPFVHSTKIRYKLTSDARSVSIRIFDLAGKLVRVLNDCPTDGTRPYHEYNDVLWDGKNGVGDEVNNGVYIYKILAVDDNGRKVDTRGKAAKLR
ncbi:MAG: Ig-like domain-containing protein [Candidatus Margulisiibacteriota bacterium]